MTALVTSPWFYVIWAAIVAAALYGTYFSDPYVFGFTTLGLAWLTGTVGVVGLGACVLSKRLNMVGRLVIVAAVALAAAAVARALATLSTFKWA